MRETAVWSAIYLAIAVVFGGSAWVFAGTAMSVGYFARIVRNETLSVDAIVEVIAVVLLITTVAR